MGITFIPLSLNRKKLRPGSKFSFTTGFSAIPLSLNRPLDNVFSVHRRRKALDLESLSRSAKTTVIGQKCSDYSNWSEVLRLQSLVRNVKTTVIAQKCSDYSNWSEVLRLQ